MFNRRRFLIQIFILLLMKVSRIRSNCSWNDSSDENCSLKCNSKSSVWPFSLKTIATIMTNLNKIWIERPVCHEDGIDLKLENIKYPDNTVAAGFFTAGVKVRTLTFKLNYMLDKSEKIETDAFVSDALKSLKKLVISNAMFDPIKKGTFNGLGYLEVLNIDGRQLRVIESGVLDALNGTLTEFSLEQAESFNSNKEILIDGLTGAGALEKLENVKFKYNLKTSIGQDTFAGVTNVKTLDLSDCQIETIAVGSFDSLNFLEVLQLTDNFLMTIPDGFFSNILIRTQIFLEGNRFLCDCTLMPFKLSLIEHSNFIGQLNCYKPEKFEGHKIIDTKFDDETCVIPTTTVVSSSTFSTTPSPSPTLECQSTDELKAVFIAPPAHKMQVYQTGDDDVMVRIDSPAESSILIWFAMDDPITASVNTNCLIGSEPTFHIDNVVINSVYTICLMDRMEVTNSPFDCVSFVKRSDWNEVPWLYGHAKSRFIGIAFVVCILSILLGSVIGGLAYRVKILMMNRKEPFIRSYQSSQCSSMRRSRMSLMTRRTTNTTVQYFINDIAPPLPARPVSMYLMDEPVYATIRDFRSICAPTTQNFNNLHASDDLELQKDNLQVSNDLELQKDNLKASDESELQKGNLKASNDLELQKDNLHASDDLELQKDNFQVSNDLELQKDNLKASDELELQKGNLKASNDLEPQKI